MSLDLLDQRRTWLLHLEANLTNRFHATETEAAARWAWCFRLTGDEVGERPTRIIDPELH